MKEKSIQLPFYESDISKRSKPSRRILLIVNPVSGRMKTKTGLFEIMDELYRMSPDDASMKKNARSGNSPFPLPFTLISEAEGKGCDNLIVGDVKQSIYRWRNSDWKLLNGVHSEFPNVQQPPMIDNWRSAKLLIQENEQLISNYAQWVANYFEREGWNNESPLAQMAAFKPLSGLYATPDAGRGVGAVAHSRPRLRRRVASTSQGGCRA